MTPIVNFVQLAREAVIMEEGKKNDREKVLSTWEIDEVNVITSKPWREWMDPSVWMLMHEFKRSSRQQHNNLQSMIALVEKMILRLINWDFNNNFSEVRSTNKRSINYTEGTHNRLIQQRHLLPSTKCGRVTLDDWKWNFPRSGSAKAVSHGDATKDVLAILEYFLENDEWFD